MGLFVSFDDLRKKLINRIRMKNQHKLYFTFRNLLGGGGHNLISETCKDYYLQN